MTDNKFITTSAGPLCITHLDSWEASVEHTDKDTSIRLKLPTVHGLTRAAIVLVTVVKREASLDALLQDTRLSLEAEAGVSDIRSEVVCDDRGCRFGQIYYQHLVPREGTEREEKLSGLMVLRCFNHQATRFDFIADELFFDTHYKEALIMSRTVELVD